MKKLTRKLLRDLVALRWQLATIAVVVASGVALLVAAFGTYRSLLEARESFYAATDFPHVFSRLSRAPDDVAAELARVDGVGAVETRLTFDSPLDLEFVREPVTVRVLSLAPAGRAPLARLLLDRGRSPEPGARDEAVVNEAFAKARRLTPGDRVHVVLNGHRQAVTIVGAVLSAEHLAAFRGGEILPDDAHFGIMWLPYEAVASAFQATGTFNEAVVRLAPGANEQAVIADIDRILAPYGGYGAHGRAEQPGHRFIDGELRELEVEATVLPAIFLGVAAFLLNAVLARLVVKERTQIATLRALGFRIGPIARHYMALAAITSGAGALLGLAVGAALGTLLTASYAPFFRFPSLAYAVDPVIVLVGFAISIGAGVAGALASVRRIARLAPAEAMQPSPPTMFRASGIGRLRFLRALRPSLRLVTRNVLARPARTASSIVGVAAAMAVLVVGTFWKGSLDALILHEFRVVRREDALITFTHAMNERAVRDVTHLPGVRVGEGVRIVPARVSHGRAEKRVDILGLPEHARLHRLVAADGTETALPPDGIVVSRHLARKLAVSAGDTLAIDVLEGARARREIAVAGVVDELVGMSAYMSIDALYRWIGEGPSVSAVLVTIDPDRLVDVHEALKAMPGVATVSMKRWTVRLFDEQFSAIVLIFSFVLSAFGTAIVAGVVYNAARILAAERARELATLRVLGFTRGDVSESLLLELGIQVSLGIPLGALLGYALCAIAVHLFGPEDMSIPLVVEPRTWALSIAIVAGAAIVSALLVRRRLDRLDLVEVLKVRE